MQLLNQIRYANALFLNAYASSLLQYCFSHLNLQTPANIIPILLLGVQCTQRVHCCFDNLRYIIHVNWQEYYEIYWLHDMYDIKKLSFSFTLLNDF